MHSHTLTHTQRFPATLRALESLLCWRKSPLCENEGKVLARVQKWKERKQNLNFWVHNNYNL